MGSADPEVKNAPETAPLLRFLRWAMPLLWRRRRFLIYAVCMGIVLFVALALLTPNTYQSTVRIMPPDSQSRSGFALMAAALGSTPMASMGLGDLMSSRSPGSAFMAILGSRTVQDDLINRFDLRKEYHQKYYVDTRRALTNRTQIEEDRKTGVLTLTVMDRDPGRARDLAAAYVDELNRLVVAMDTSQAHRERVFLEGRLQAVKQDLDAATQQLGQFSSRNATMDMQGQATVMLQATARLQGELMAAQTELHGLQAIYSPDNARVREEQARVDALQGELRKLAGSQQANGGDLDANQIYPSLRELPLLGVTYADLYRRAMIQETIYEVLTKQYEVAKVEEAREIPTVKLLDPPDYPETKTYPRRRLMVMLGTLFTIICAASWILCKEAWQGMDSSHPAKAAVHELLLSIKKR
jgi:capsule polysaccharide export protein KpsE/RkpR